MSLSQYILDSREQYRLEVRQRNLWLIQLRWYYLLFLAAITMIASALTNDNPSRNRRIVLIAAGTGLAVNLLLWLLARAKSKKISYYHSVAVAQLVMDVALAASVVYLQGGLTSRATVLFAIPIVGAGLLFARSFAYSTALLSAVGYTLVLVLYRHNNPGSYELRQVTLPAVFYGAVFILIAAIVSGYRSRTASNEREKSYAELLSLLRHQLYHPSSVIAAIIDMLEHTSHYPNWPAVDKNYLEQLKHENERLHTMIANMLESITDHDQELKNIETIDIVKLLNEESVSAALGAKRVADLEAQLPNKSITIEADRDQLSTALMNIIGNAFRYTDQGTPVIISVAEDKDIVTISVHDKGKGISEQEQRALFKMFSKMESRISGDPEKLYDTGLGLYVSKVIIERHKGKLELSSSAQYGTNVTLTLRRRFS